MTRRERRAERRDLVNEAAIDHYDRARGFDRTLAERQAAAQARRAVKDARA